MHSDPRRNVPSTDVLLQDPRLAEAEQRLGRALVRATVHASQERVRAATIAPERFAERREGYKLIDRLQKSVRRPRDRAAEPAHIFHAKG